MSNKARMMLANLNYDVLKTIFQIYDAVVGGKGLQYFSQTDFRQIKERLEAGSFVYKVLGSKITSYSAIRIDIVPKLGNTDLVLISFSFDGNLSSVDPEERSEIEKSLAKEFEEAVVFYLEGLGLLAAGTNEKDLSMVSFGPTHVPTGHRWCAACIGTGGESVVCGICKGKGHWNNEDIKEYHKNNPNLCRVLCGGIHTEPDFWKISPNTMRKPNS